MLQSFNSLLIKFNVQPREHLARIFSSPLYVREYFFFLGGGDRLVQDFAHHPPPKSSMDGPFVTVISYVDCPHMLIYKNNISHETLVTVSTERPHDLRFVLVCVIKW